MPESNQVPDQMGFGQFWWESIKHGFTKAWRWALAVSGVLAIAVPCARLISANPQYQTFFDILEKYWAGWILIVVFLLILFGRICYAPFLIYQQSETKRSESERKLQSEIAALSDKIITLEDRLTPRITVSCDDEKCILRPGESINPMFRVIAHLGGDVLVTNVVARVEAIRKDGHKLPLLEPIRLRFHSSGGSGELETMRPEDSEPLDMLKLVDGELRPALAYDYEAFNHRCCNDPNHTYELDVSISSSIKPTKFTYVCHWAGDFNTTKPYIKQPSSVPNMATSQRLPTL